VRVYILAGGHSHRFGSDKARAVVGGAELIVSVARALEPVARTITVVAGRAGAYDDLGLRTVGDVIPARGPLGGLLTALEDAGDDGWLLLSSCDWMGLRREWLVRLLEARRDGMQVVAYRGSRYQPLLALYHHSLLAEARRAVQGNDRSLQTFIENANTVGLALPREWSTARNVNRPGDIE
jgi:molybdopterin-guanine dinucleotide biosynthesis protein A